MPNDDFVKKIVAQFMPCTCHIDHTTCQNLDCVEYSNIIDFVEENMTPQQAIELILERTNLTFERAKFHVDAMLDTGYLV